MKAILVKVIQDVVKDFQEKRAQITDDDVKKFMARRKLSPYPAAWKDEMEAQAKKAAEEAEKKKKKAGGEKKELT